MSFVMHGERILIRTRKKRYLNAANGSGPITMTDNHEHDPATSDELWWVERLAGNGRVEHGDKVFLHSRKNRFLNAANGSGPLAMSVNHEADPAVSDEVWWIERLEGKGEVQHGEAIFLRTRKNRYLNTGNGVGPVVQLTDNHDGNPAKSDELWWAERGEVPIDNNVPVFPIIEEAGGARGSARVEVGDDGIVTLEMTVDAPAGGNTTRYVACAVITGYRDSEPTNILLRIEPQSLTVASSPFSKATKSRRWEYDICPEDVNNIRHIRLFLERNKSEPNLATQIIDTCRKAGEVWVALDSLYKKVKNSELGKGIALAAAD